MKTRRRRFVLRGTGKHDFPFKKRIKYDDLIVTEEGEYSMTKRKDGEILLHHMKQLVKNMKSKTITDLTGNVGSDTILFALHFKHVHSIELDSENFEALQNNVNTFKLKNVTLYHGDSTKLYNWYTDILYIDAPWGGPDYKTKSSLDLYLGNTRLDLFLKDVIQRDNRPEYIFLKLPRNYNFERLDIPFQKFKIRGYYLVGITL